MSDELDVLKEMRDTSPEMERQFVEMMMRRSGQERLKGEDFPPETQEKIFRQIERISEESKF